MDDLRRLDVETRSLRGNEALLLGDPNRAWIIDSGSVVVFRTDLEDGKPQGNRRFFFSARPGDALFGFPAVPKSGRGVIAVALEETTLRSFDLRTAVELGEPARRWVERWTDSAGLEDHQAGEPTPLPARIAAFHEALLERIDKLEAQDLDQDHKRFLARGRISREAAEEALGTLTAVLQPRLAHLPAGPPFFVAAYVAAQATGVELRMPPTWERGNQAADPVELIARASHCRVRKVVLHEGWWEQDCGPLLGFLGRERKPVALLPRSPTAYDLFDPATGQRSPFTAEQAANLDPEAHAFHRSLPSGASSGLQLIRFALSGRGADLLLILLAGIGATALGMFTPQAMALIVDHAIPDANGRLLLQIGLGLGAATFGAALFRLAQGIAMMRLETGADVAAQSAVWDRLLNLQLSFFRRFSTGDLQSRVTAVSQIRMYLGGTTLRSLFSSVILLLNLALLLYYSRLLTLVAVGVALVTAVVTVASGLMILRCTRQILEREGHFFGLMVQLINGVSKLRVAAAEERAFGRWARDYAELLALDVRQRKIQDRVQGINVAVNVLSKILLFAIAATLVRQSEMGAALSTGVFLAFNTAFGTFIGAMGSLSNTVTDVMAIAILRERVRPILEANPEVHDHKADPGRLSGRIDLDHVTFQYDPEGPVILDDVSLRIEAGQFVAFVGPSGSGKSTIFRLLLGFESPQSGAVYFDGQDLVGIDVYAVRRQMGVVLQHGRINSGSLFDNIVCGARVSLNDAWEAARATGFAGDIEEMPMGMHTVISEGGTNLSGGQRQRLLLTRALVHKPGILMLDEATSALDNETQAIVSRSLEELAVTRLVVAHRLSTIRHADRIFVIESGRIVQQGSFEELSAEEGLFARLMARQMT